MFYTIYQTTCLINGKVYVGMHKTENLNDNYSGQFNSETEDFRMRLSEGWIRGRKAWKPHNKKSFALL